MVYYPACMRRGKVISLSVCLLLSSRKSSDLDIQASEQLICVLKSVKKWLEYASNHLAQSTNITNSVFLLVIVVTPIDHAHQHFLLMCTTELVEIVNINTWVYMYLCAEGCRCQAHALESSNCINEFSHSHLDKTLQHYSGDVHTTDQQLE